MILEQHQHWNPSRAVLRQALGLVYTHAWVITQLWLGLAILLGIWVLVASLVSASAFVTSVVGGVFAALVALYKVGMSASQVHVVADLKARSLNDIARQSVLPRLPALAALYILMAVATFVGVFAGVIPGVVLYVFWSLAVMVLLIERTTVKQALQGSVRLVRGWWWPMLHRHLFWLTIITLQTCIGLVPSVGVLVSGLLSLVFVPAGVFYFYLTYKELVGIKQFSHMQTSQVTIVGKLLLVVWGLALFAALAFVGSAQSFVNAALS